MSVVAVRPKPKPITHLSELRCPFCNRLIARARLVPGSAVELHCRHCKRWVLREVA